MISHMEGGRVKGLCVQTSVHTYIFHIIDFQDLKMFDTIFFVHVAFTSSSIFTATNKKRSYRDRAKNSQNFRGESQIDVTHLNVNVTFRLEPPPSSKRHTQNR